MNDLVTPTFLAPARVAGAAWAEAGLPARLGVVRRARRLMAGRATALARTIGRPVADTLVAEVLPLLEAARFLEREAPALLAARRLRGGRPAWLFGVTAEIRREPLGAVLILGPGNYPLFLPGAQALQALAAGNAAAWKPAAGGAAAAAAFAAAMREAGLPDGVLTVLGEEDGPAAVAAGFDKIVLTGSAETGVRVLEAAAARLTPTTMELSGSDAVFVLPGADLELVARCLAYGLRLNGGATCIAPRRVFVPREMAEALEGRLAPLLPGIADATVPAAVAERLERLLAKAVAAGARLHHAGRNRPAVLAEARAEMALLKQDVFAPWLALVPVADVEEALRLDLACPYRLGASVFGPGTAARAVAGRVRAGSVCVNDLIVPTADPRLPFGGAGRSGFGRTRGGEGLLAMTAAKTVSVRSGRFRPHLRPDGPDDARQFAAMIGLLHGGWRGVAASVAALARRP